MIYIIAALAGIFLAVAALEIISLRTGLEKVIFRSELNMELTEPDEIMTFSYRVGNTSRFPLMFVSYSFMFTDGLKVMEDGEWMERHRVGSFLSDTYTFDTYLSPRSGLHGKIRLAADRRGVHRVGKVYIEAGDFLGLTTRMVSYDLGLSVVCTARRCEDEPEISALGGLMGEVSVRRFIMDDPSLVLGYREYTGTEPFRSISWLQTAKTGALTVKRHDFTVDNHVAVLADVEDADESTVERFLSLLRTACDELETLRVPYSLLTNGDLLDTPRGSGRMHTFSIQRRIGVSRCVKFKPFSEVVDRCLAEGSGMSGAIVVVTRLDAETEAELRRISESSGAAVCILVGEKET